MKQKFLTAVMVLTLMGTGCEKISKNNNSIFCSPTGELIRTQTMQSQRTYCIQTQKEEPTPKNPIDYTFTIIDDQGEKLKNTDLTKDTQIDVTIVRADLTQFQHPTPTFDPQTGYITLNKLTFAEPGSYFFYIRFFPKDGNKDKLGNPIAVTLREEISVGDTSQKLIPTIPKFSPVQNVDTFTVTLSLINTVKEKVVTGVDTQLQFQVEEKTGKPIEHVEKYLGELGHLIVLHEQTLEYIQVHPVRSITNKYNNIPFVVAFPKPGNYKMFLEFKYAGTVHHVEYGIHVEQGTSENTMDPIK